ncbi:Severe Depolymerization of Actin, partial [Coemansia nantahalensis]
GEDEGDAEADAANAGESQALAKPAVKKRIEMTRFLTNEEFAQIERLKKRKRASESRAPAKKRAGSGAVAAADEAMDVDGGSDGSSSDSESDDGFVKDWDILGDYHSRRRTRKATYEERMESIRAGREGREKYSSSKAKRDKESRGLSNKEKRKTKSFKMIAHKRSVVSKGKRSLAQKRRELRQHIVKQKKKGH